MRALPYLYEKKLEEQLASIPMALLRKHYLSLQEKYSLSDDNDSGTRTLSKEEVYSYLAARWPATFHACSQTLERSLPSDLKIHSALDLGAGTLASTAALLHHFPSLSSVISIERDAFALEVGRSILSSSAVKTLCSSVATIPLMDPFPELVHLSYSWGELPATTQKTLLQAIRAAHYIVVIDPGTPRGFLGITPLRQALLSSGFSIVAPCTHQHACPLSAYRSEQKWCHFRVAYERPRFQQKIKEAPLPYEEESYSYIVFAKSHPKTVPQNRVIDAPQKRSGHIRLSLCTDAGTLEQVVVSKKNTHYQETKKIGWGDIFNQS